MPSFEAVILIASLCLSLTWQSLAQNPYCDTAYFFYLDGTRKKGNADWASYGAVTGFGKGPCTQVSGISMTVTYLSTVIILDRSDATNSYVQIGRELAYGQEIILATGEQRPLDVLTNTFCSTGGHLPDGTMVSIGGDWSPGGYIKPGQSSVRTFKPCVDKKCVFSIAAMLQRGRWYPTAQILGNGRMLIVGGSNRGVGLNWADSNVPNLEYWPANGQGVFELQLLKDTVPYNLYPFVHLLPSGNVFIFAGTKWVLWDTNANRVVPNKAYPELNQYDPQGRKIYRSYPLTATSALLPLTSTNNYRAEVIICGGASTGSLSSSGQNEWNPADTWCYTTYPEDGTPVWAGTKMKYPRVMPMAVLLPDGNLFIVGGIQTGWAGLNTVGHKAALEPEMYNAYTRSWYTKGLVVSKIPRAYHATAALLSNGHVFVTGSNHNTWIKLDGSDYPTDFRSEIFYPPYAQYMTPRPSITAAPATITYSVTFSLTFTFTKAGTVSVVLSQPGFSTHSNNHGMRNVLLDVVNKAGRAGSNTIQVKGPPNKNVCPPTWYWLFVLVDGIPNGEGKYVFVA